MSLMNILYIIFIVISTFVGVVILTVIWDIFEYDIRIFCADPWYWITRLRGIKSKNLSGKPNKVLPLGKRGFVKGETLYKPTVKTSYIDRTKFNNDLLKARHSKNRVHVNHKARR